MRKRFWKKNFRGDTLVEIITSFTIIAIVGLITVTGVVAGSRLKLSTTNLKNASLEADADLQNQTLCNTSFATATISSVDSTTGSKTTIKKGLTLGKYTGTSTNNKVEYSYYDSKYGTGTTTNPGTGNVTTIKKFGLTGAWFVRFYLDDNTTITKNHTLVINLTGGRPGSKLTWNDKSVSDIHYGGLVSNGTYAWYESSNFASKSLVNVDTNNLYFDENGNVTLNIDVTIAYGSYDVDYIDIPIWWTGDSFYGISIDLLNNSGVSIGNIVNKYKVYKTSLDILTPISGSVLTMDYSGSLDQGTSSTPGADKVNATFYGAYQYNCAADDDSQYIYIWSRDETETYGEDGTWLEGFETELNQRLTWTGAYKSLFKTNAFASPQESNYFREYLRTEGGDCYEEYKTWCGITDKTVGDDIPPDKTTVYWLYYMLDVVKERNITALQEIQVTDAKGNIIDKPSSFEDYVKTYMATSSLTSDDTAKKQLIAFLLTQYDNTATDKTKNLYNKVQEYINNKSDVNTKFTTEFMWAWFCIEKYGSYTYNEQEFSNLKVFCSQVKGTGCYSYSEIYSTLRELYYYLYPNDSSIEVYNKVKAYTDSNGASLSEYYIGLFMAGYIGITENESYTYTQSWDGKTVVFNNLKDFCNYVNLNSLYSYLYPDTQ